VLCAFALVGVSINATTRGDMGPNFPRLLRRACLLMRLRCPPRTLVETRANNSQVGVFRLSGVGKMIVLIHEES
jgi:hypothetical protein